VLHGGLAPHRAHSHPFRSGRQRKAFAGAGRRKGFWNQAVDHEGVVGAVDVEVEAVEKK
jgi:hypothetical protein